MARLLCVLALAGAMFAADFTGTWNGTVQRPAGAGSNSIHLRLQQNGAEVTGSIGPNPDKQLPVTKSVVSGDKATIEAAIPNRDARLVITVQRDGDKLSGELKQIGAAAEETIGAFKASRE
jgi:hypothetical protein